MCARRFTTSASSAPAPAAERRRRFSPRAGWMWPCWRPGRAWIQTATSRSTSGPTSCRIAVSVSAGVRTASATNSWPPTDSGKSKASRTLRRPAQLFAGSAPGLKADAPTTGGASRCGSGRRIFAPAPPTAWATIGRSPTKSLRPTTTRSNPTSASSGRKRMSPMRRTAFSSRRPGHAAPRP